MLGTCASSGRPIAATVLLDLMRDLRPGTTLHGLRSTFRTWAAESTNVRQDIAEAAYFLAADHLSAKSTGNILNVDAGNLAAFTR